MTKKSKPVVQPPKHDMLEGCKPLGRGCCALFTRCL